MLYNGQQNCVNLKEQMRKKKKTHTCTFPCLIVGSVPWHVGGASAAMTLFGFVAIFIGQHSMVRRHWEQQVTINTWFNLLEPSILIEEMVCHSAHTETLDWPSRRESRSLRRSSALRSRSLNSRCSFCCSRNFRSRSRWRSSCSSRSLWSKRNPGESNWVLSRQPKGQTCHFLVASTFIHIWQSHLLLCWQCLNLTKTRNYLKYYICWLNKKTGLRTY